MADFLTIDGVAYGVLESGAGQGASEEIGEEKRAIDGTLRSSVQGGKRVFTFSLEPMPQASFMTLETKSLSGNFYACGGAALPATAVYRPRITRATYVVKDLSFLRAVDIELRAQ